VSDFYTRMLATAKRLITKYGQSVTFTNGQAGGTYSLGGYSGGTPTTITGVGAAISYAKGEVDGELIRQSDVKLLFEGGQGAPVQGYTCAVNGTTYRVMNANPLSPGGTVVIYEVQLRA
jgi:hypothetical protein